MTSSLVITLRLKKATAYTHTHTHTHTHKHTHTQTMMSKLTIKNDAIQQEKHQKTAYKIFPRKN